MSRDSLGRGVRGSQLGALLLSIAAGCGESQQADPSGTVGDCNSPYDAPTQVPVGDVEGLPVADGHYALSACELLCADVIGDGIALVSCGPSTAAHGDPDARGLVDAPAGGGGSGSTGPGGSESGDSGSGGSSTGAGSTGDDATSTAGEPTSGEPTTTAGDTDDATTDGGALVTIVCTIDPMGCDVGGRLSAALSTSGRTDAVHGTAAWFASMAHAEAASVVSFVRLAAALASHGAPAELVAAARDAARDEARHARIMRAGAQLRGVTPQRPRHTPAAPISASAAGLEALAVDNAVEGCVHETWAALVILWQARHAPDAALRADLAAIAADEVRHAELAWAIDRWVCAQLTPAARARVEQARMRAATALLRAAERARAPLPEVGIPHGADARRLVEALHAALWSTDRSPSN